MRTPPDGGSLLHPHQLRGAFGFPAFRVPFELLGRAAHVRLVDDVTDQWLDKGTRLRLR